MEKSKFHRGQYMVLSVVLYWLTFCSNTVDAETIANMYAQPILESNSYCQDFLGMVGPVTYTEKPVPEYLTLEDLKWRIPGLPIYIDGAGRFRTTFHEMEVYLTPTINVKLTQGQLEAESSFILGARKEL